MADGAFHGRGIDSILASPFQSLALGPLDQESLDLLQGAGLDAADVVLEARGARSPARRKTSKAAIALRVVQEERQLGVGQLLPVLEDRRAQNLIRGETRSPLIGLGVVTQIM